MAISVAVRSLSTPSHRPHPSSENESLRGSPAEEDAPPAGPDRPRAREANLRSLENFASLLRYD